MTFFIGQYYLADPDMKSYRWIVDDKLDCYGEVSYRERVVRINLQRHRREHASLIDTLLHEYLHIKYPKGSEADICRLTSVMLPVLSRKFKQSLYRKVRLRS